MWEAVNFNITQPLYEIIASVLVGPEVFNESKAVYPYPDPLPVDFRLFASTLLTDGLFVCATRNASEALAVAQPARKSPVFHFQYSHLLSWGPGAWGANFTGEGARACGAKHGGRACGYNSRRSRARRVSATARPLHSHDNPRLFALVRFQSATTKCATGASASSAHTPFGQPRGRRSSA